MLSQTTVNKELIIQEACWLIFYCSVVFIPGLLYRILFFTVSRKTDTYLRKRVISHLQKVKPEYFEKENKGAFLAYLSKEILSIRKILGNNWFNLDKIIITPIIAIIFIWGQFNKMLALWLIPIFPIAGICIANCYKKLKEKIEISRKTYVELSKNIEKNTDGFLLIKSYNQQEKEIEKFKDINSRMYKADYEIGVAKNRISRVINILYGLCFIISFIAGIEYIKLNMMTIGELTAFIGYISNALHNFVGATQKLLERMPYLKQSLDRFDYFLNLDEYKKDGKSLDRINTIELTEIFEQLEEIQSSFMSLKRINVLLKENGVEDIEKGEKCEDLKGDIEFNNVYMQYGNNKVLKGVSFNIKEGSKVTIAGKTGVGKTTMMNILMRLYPFQKGEILIGGKDITKIRIKDIRKNISYISQTPYILEDTLKNNIVLGNENITDEQIKTIAGELQMIAFLRAILHKTNIYIFDEPTSNIDLKTEDRIQKLIDKITKESTVIIIAHRKSTIENSDKIIYLKDGRVDMIKNVYN